MDIQEFYELTLMDEGKPTDIKVSEAIEMAARWEMGQVSAVFLILIFS